MGPGPESKTGGAIARDGCSECVRTHAPLRIHVDVAKRGLAHSGNSQRLVDAVMRLRCEIHDSTAVVRAPETECIASRGNRGEIRDASARRNTARRCGRITHQVRRPAQQLVLHADCAGPGEENSRVLVADGGKKVAQCGVIQSTTWYVCAVAARGRRATRMHNVVLKQLDRGLDIDAAPRYRRIEKRCPLLIGLIIRARIGNASQVPLCACDNGAAELLSTRRTGFQCTRCSFERTDLITHGSPRLTVQLSRSGDCTRAP